MLKDETSFNDFKKDVLPLLDSFIRVNETMAAIMEINGDPFEGMLVLEEAKALQRIAPRLSPTNEACGLIETTLKAVSVRSKKLGMDVMAHEAGTLLERLSHLQAAASASSE
jgi:hypothetical protein